ncbi:hypothetical protein [Streptomyces sp. SP18CS02]|uniref:hypothetical protein n=1 Tax=Streptomyces sp. SP18CS02 TaxID=3002531 RepID=UPI002E772287|nr:hypothetical protein [Streptomyces sp. SP18CS02]MEE1753476.1 hypothetical protein [Streptomyces sp. SP18CS02]
MPLRSLISPAITSARLLRHGSSVGAELPPDEAVTLDAPVSAALRDALTSAARGEHGPARELLAATRLGGEWERRGVYVAELAEAALHNPGWLATWLEGTPEDPDAMLVKAHLCVRQAWETRTGHDRFRAFFALLADAVPVISTAAALQPADPVPWEIALTHARGAQAPREVFDAYWSEATARSPHHYGCHAAALRYLGAGADGSYDEMLDFAERAAEHALPGSTLHALPLLAVIEHEPAAGAVRIAPGRITAAVERALELSGHYEPGDPEAAGFRNDLALMLVRAKRWPEALETFRAIDVHARSRPWGYVGDARTEFLRFRTGVRMHIAATTPLLRTPPPPPAPVATRTATHALAIALAPPPKVAAAALMCGVPLRVVPAGPAASYVELTAGHAPGRRAALIGGDPLTTAADTFTTGEQWPALVLRRTGDRYAFTALHRGREVAVHEWDPAAPVTDHAAATATARALATTFAVADARPLAHLLRGGDAPARRQRDLVTALGLPELPPAFGERPEALAGLPGAGVLAGRGFLAGLRDTLADTPRHLLVPESGPARPVRWWLPRTLALLLLTAGAAYGWWSPDVDWIRATLVSLTAIIPASQLASARRRGGG